MNSLGLYTEKKEKKEVKPDLLSQLETALATQVETKAEAVTAPLSTQTPTVDQKQEQKKLVETRETPNLWQPNKLGMYACDSDRSDAARALSIQRMNDSTDLQRIRQQNDSLRHLSSQFGLSDLSNRSHKKYVKKSYNKLSSQTQV